VAQVLDTYIIAVAADGSLVLVDQHAAHERLTHEAIRDQMLSGGVRSQPLLIPAVVDMPAADAARLIFHASDLADLGLEIEAFGAGAILVRAMPAALGTPDPGPLLRDVADELARPGSTLSSPVSPATAASAPAAGWAALKWTPCCARWKQHRGPRHAATAGRRSSS
jgi:DNA mismatch repair ATPase MutL